MGFFAQFLGLYYDSSDPPPASVLDALRRAIAVTHHRYAGRSPVADLWRVAVAVGDEFLRFGGSEGRLEFECRRVPELADLVDDPPPVLPLDRVFADPALSVAEKAVAVHSMESLFGFPLRSP